MTKLNFKIIIFFVVPLFIVYENFSLSTYAEGLKAFEEITIDATKNATLHNNMGNIYFDEKNYFGALEEYKIAYQLNPKGQIGAVYLYNIARCYIIFNKIEEAKNLIEQAIFNDCMNLVYYDFLAQCYSELGIKKSEFNKLLNDEINPYNKILAGLIYLKRDEKLKAKAVFENFIKEYPSMEITQDIESLLNRL